MGIAVSLGRTTAGHRQTSLPCRREGGKSGAEVRPARRPHTSAEIVPPLQAAHN